MNVYEMYVENGNKAGFWVRRNSWGPSSFAQVTRIAGNEKGAINGNPPYFNNQAVICDFYMNGRLHTKDMSLSCPGTFSYNLIDKPI
jgi:hypothetical protein